MLLKSLPLCVCGFGNSHSIVCHICNRDEEICLLALRRPGGVNKHHRDTKGKKHSCSIWAKDGLVWAGLLTTSPPFVLPPAVSLWEGGSVAGLSHQSNTNVFMLWCLFPLCGPLSLVCHTERVFPCQLLNHLWVMDELFALAPYLSLLPLTHFHTNLKCLLCTCTYKVVHSL